jgi:hypothetical protein
MAEILRNCDTGRAGIRHSVCILLLCLTAAAAAQSPDLERRLEAAIYREVVLGDLHGAMEEYKSLSGKSGDVAARAERQMAQCQEKLSHGFPGPRNLDFNEGVVGKAPPGWIVPVLPKDVNYFAELRRTGCREHSGCAVVLVPANAPRPFGTIMQSFSAVPYRGKTVRLRAWMRVEAVNPDDGAQMRLSVDRENHKDGFFDNMDDRPVRSAEWTRCEITGFVDEDARFIEIGMMSVGRGRVWVDDVSFEVIPSR